MDLGVWDHSMWKFLVLMLSSLVLSCTSVTVTVRAEAPAAIPKSKQWVFVVPQNDPYLKDVESALSRAGYLISGDVEKSDLVVEFKYSMEWEDRLSIKNEEKAMKTETLHPSSGYERVIILTSYETKQWKTDGSVKTKEVWRTSIESLGLSGDLKALFPTLIDAAIPYFGIDSKGAIDVSAAPRQGPQ
jgi:hypothetical protein